MDELTPYERLCEDISAVLSREQGTTLQKTLEEIWGDEITFYWKRKYNIRDIIDYLPVVIVDIQPAEIGYNEYDQGYDRDIPIGVYLYLPFDTQNLSVEEKADAEENLDLKLKQLYTTLEEILNSLTGKNTIVRDLRLVSGSMPYDVIPLGDANTGRDVKIGIINLQASNLIAG